MREPVGAGAFPPTLIRRAGATCGKESGSDDQLPREPSRPRVSGRAIEGIATRDSTGCARGRRSGMHHQRLLLHRGGHLHRSRDAGLFATPGRPPRNGRAIVQCGRQFHQQPSPCRLVLCALSCLRTPDSATPPRSRLRAARAVVCLLPLAGSRLTSRRRALSHEPPAWSLPWLRVQLRVRFALDTRLNRTTWLQASAALKTVLDERRRIRSAGWFN